MKREWIIANVKSELKYCAKRYPESAANADTWNMARYQGEMYALRWVLEMLEDKTRSGED